MCSMWVPCVIDVQHVCAMYNGCAVCVCQDVFACLCAYIDRKICDIGPCYRLLHLECYFFLIKSYLLSRSLMPCLCEKRQPENPVRAHLLRNKQHIVIIIKKKNSPRCICKFVSDHLRVFVFKQTQTHVHTHTHTHTHNWVGSCFLRSFRRIYVQIFEENSRIGHDQALRLLCLKGHVRLRTR